MSALMTNIPAQAVAHTASSMIPTISVVNDLDRAQNEKNLQELVKTDEVRNALLERGISPDEVSGRMASLSDSELRQLSMQVETARVGGDILVTILVVILIIFLIKRI